MKCTKLICFFLSICLLPGLILAQERGLDERVRVSRELLDVRVLDVGGNPILGLNTQDFQLKISGERIPLETALWIEASGSMKNIRVASGPDEEGEDSFLDRPIQGREPEPDGQLITIFIQTELIGRRMASYLQMPRFMKGFLEQLDDKDYVAVYGFGSRLNLYCDFTRDRDVALDAIQLATRRSKEVAFMASNSPSLVPYYQEDDARDVAKPEDALKYLAENLGVFPGNKAVIYLGFGFGRFSGGNVYMEPEYKRTVRALNQARINIFSVDITRADYHPLEQGMRRIAEDTGGAYYSARVFPENAMRRVVNAISGYYRLSFVLPDDLGKNPKYRLQLKNRKGRLYVKNPYNGAPKLP